MIQPDFRALCEQLMEIVEGKQYNGGNVIAKARTALATPPSQPPTDEELVAFLYMIDPDDELSNLAMARAALERWGHG